MQSIPVTAVFLQTLSVLIDIPYSSLQGVKIGSPLYTCERLNLMETAWKPLSDMNQSRHNFNPVLYHECIYLPALNSITNLLESLDTRSGIFTTHCVLPGGNLIAFSAILGKEIVIFTWNRVHRVGLETWEVEKTQQVIGFDDTMRARGKAVVTNNSVWFTLYDQEKVVMYDLSASEMIAYVREGEKVAVEVVYLKSINAKATHSTNRAGRYRH